MQVSIGIGGDDLLSQDMIIISYLHTSKFLSTNDALNNICLLAKAAQNISSKYTDFSKNEHCKTVSIFSLYSKVYTTER